MYCEKLSEQLTVADQAVRVATTGATGATTITGNAIDGAEYNRLIAYSVVDVAKSATGASWTINWQASTVSGFTGTSTTVATCTGTIATPAANTTTYASCSVDGETVQASRVAEDRYVRAVLTTHVKSAHAIGADLLVLADAKRYHPN